MPEYPTQRALQSVPDKEPVVPSHDPTGAIPWPTVLLEGGEKAGKSYELALFSGCGEFSQTWWIEVGMEGTAEMYKLVPGSQYRVVEHSGSIPEIMARLAIVHQHAVWSNATGRKPVMVVVDSGGAIWKITQAWVDWRARQTDSARKLLRNNPNADIKAPINIRNEGTAMWMRFIAAVNDIPAVKVITSRGQEVTKFENGQPTTEKAWSVVGHREFGFEVDIWCRLARNKPAEVVGIRAVVDGIRPGDDAFKPELIRRQDFSMRWLVFERYGLAPATAYVRPRNNTDDARLADPAAVDQPDDDEARQQQRYNEDVILGAAQLLDDAKKAMDKAAFKPLWDEAKERGWAQVPLITGVDQTSTLLELLTIEAKRIGELDKQQAAGEPEPVPGEAARPAAPASSTRQGKPEILRLMDQLKVIAADQWVLLTGIAQRPVSGLDNLRGEPLELVLNELRNLAALGEEREPLIGDFMMQGGEIIGRVSRSQSVA